MMLLLEIRCGLLLLNLNLLWGQGLLEFLNLLLQIIDFVVLKNNDRILLIQFLHMLLLLLLGKEKGALKLVVQLPDLLVDAEQDLLLAHVLYRLDGLRIFLIVLSILLPGEVQSAGWTASSRSELVAGVALRIALLLL